MQLVVHTLVLLFVLDLYYMPYLFPSHREASLKFARVGALGSSSATLHVRYPEPLPRVTGLWETGIQEALVDASDINEAPLRIVWRRVHESEVKIRASQHRTRSTPMGAWTSATLVKRIGLDSYGNAV